MCAAFLCLQFRFVLYRCKTVGAKAARRMLVKLTPGWIFLLFSGGGVSEREGRSVLSYWRPLSVEKQGLRWQRGVYSYMNVGLSAWCVCVCVRV